MRGRSRNGHENDEVNPVHAGLILAETTPPRRWVVAAGSGATDPANEIKGARGDAGSRFSEPWRPAATTPPQS